MKLLTERILKAIEDYSGCKVISIADKIIRGDNSFSGTFGEYTFQKSLKECLKYYMTGNYSAALIASYSLLSEMIYNCRIRSIDDVRRSIGTFENYLELSPEYDEAKKLIDDDILSELKPTGVSELNGFSSIDIAHIKESINGSYFKIYRYRGGVLPKKDFRIKDTIVASDNIHDFLDRKETDYINVTVGLFIEKKIALSYFMITFSYKESVWFLSDRIEYKNLRQIDKLRGGGRRYSESRESALDFLPYRLIDDIIEKRKNTDAIAKEGRSETYTFGVNDNIDLKSLYYIVKFTLQSICSNPDKCVQVYDGSKAIGDKIEKSYFSTINSDRLDAIVEELHPIESLPTISCSSLVKKVTDVVSLATNEEVERNVQYIQFENIALDFNRRQREVAKSNVYPYNEIELLRVFLQKKLKFDEFDRILFSGNSVKLVDIDHPFENGGFGGYDYNLSYWSFVTIFGDKKEAKYFPKCECCKGSTAYLKVKFLRYTEMMFLLGCKREELPIIAQNYLSRYYIPYMGNTLLDNVNPKYEELERDPLSRSESSGIDVCFYYCKKCINEKLKKYKVADDSVVVFSSKENKVLDILPYSEYKKNKKK